MKRGKLVGLVGYMGAGKTTTTNRAIEGDNRFARVGFSDPFREMLAICGVPHELYDDKSRWNDPLPALCGQTIRHATRTLGTEWGRQHIGADFWTGIAMRRIEEHREAGRTVIIDNVRFPSEFNAVEDAGGITVAFLRPGTAIDVSHESEHYIAMLQDKSQRRFNHRNPYKHSTDRFLHILEEIHAMD
jgi:hypothetical protein